MREYIENNKGTAVEVPRLNDRDVVRGAEIPHMTSLRSATLPWGGGLKRRRAVALLLCFVMLLTTGCKSILVSGDLSFKAYDPVQPMGAEAGLRNVIQEYGSLDMAKYQIDGDAAFWLPPYVLNPIYLEYSDGEDDDEDEDSSSNTTKRTDFKMLGYDSTYGQLFYAFLLPWYGEEQAEEMKLSVSGNAADVTMPEEPYGEEHGAVLGLMGYNPEKGTYIICHYHYFTEDTYEAGNLNLLAGEVTGAKAWYIYDGDVLYIYGSDGTIMSSVSYGSILTSTAISVLVDRSGGNKFSTVYEIYKKLDTQDPAVRVTVSDVQVDGTLTAYFSAQAEVAKDQAALDRADSSNFSQYDDVDTNTEDENSGDYEYINGVFRYNFSFSTTLMDIGGENAGLKFISRLPEEYIEKLKSLGTMETCYVVEDNDKKLYGEWAKGQIAARGFSDDEGLRTASELSAYGYQKDSKDALEKEKWVSDNSFYGNGNISMDKYGQAKKLVDANAAAASEKKDDKKEEEAKKTYTNDEIWTAMVADAETGEGSYTLKSWQTQDIEQKYLEQTPLVTQIMNSFPVFDTSDTVAAGTSLYMALGCFEGMSKFSNGTAKHKSAKSSYTNIEGDYIMSSFQYTDSSGKKQTQKWRSFSEDESMFMMARTKSPYHDKVGIRSSVYGITPYGIKQIMSSLVSMLSGGDTIYGSDGYAAMELIAEKAASGTREIIVSNLAGATYENVSGSVLAGGTLPWCTPGAYNYSGSKAGSWQPAMEDGSVPKTYNAVPLNIVNRWQPDSSGFIPLTLAYEERGIYLRDGGTNYASDRNKIINEMPMILPYFETTYSDGTKDARYLALDFDTGAIAKGHMLNISLFQRNTDRYEYKSQIYYPLPRMEVYETTEITLTDKLTLHWGDYKKELGSATRTIQIPTAYRMVYPEGVRVVVGGQANISDGVKAMPELGSVFYSSFETNSTAKSFAKVFNEVEDAEYYCNIWRKNRESVLAGYVPGQARDMAYYDMDDHGIFVLFTSDLTRFYRRSLDAGWVWQLSNEKPRYDYLSITNEQLTEASGYSLSVTSEVDKEGLSGTDLIAAEAQESEVNFTLSPEKLYPYTDDRLLVLVDNSGVELIDATNTSRIRILPLMGGGITIMYCLLGRMASTCWWASRQKSMNMTPTTWPWPSIM